MGTYTFVTSKAGLTKEVVFHDGDLSTGYHCTEACDVCNKYYYANEVLTQQN